jgi:iron(III) transport system ATP-binding protein
MPAVEVTNLVKRYGDNTVLDLDGLTIGPNERFVVVGPNGSGKSTLLRIIAGLIEADAGTVQLAGADMGGVPPHLRSIGVVFQGLALWPHLSVRGNICLGLNRVLPSESERKARVAEIAEELAITSMLSRRPAELSGGERQRVALARALVRRPALLLLDEPFSDLDTRLRRSTARLLARQNVAMLLITHDRTDAFLLADRIGVLRKGRMVACGTPGELAADPGSAFAAEFLGDASFLGGEANGRTASTALGEMSLRSDAQGPVLIALRPEEIECEIESAPGGLEGVVIGSEFAGNCWHLRVAIGDSEVVATHAESVRPGETVTLRVSSAAQSVVQEDR